MIDWYILACENCGLIQLWVKSDHVRPNTPQTFIKRATENVAENNEGLYFTELFQGQRGIPQFTGQHTRYRQSRSYCTIKSWENRNRLFWCRLCGKHNVFNMVYNPKKRRGKHLTGPALLDLSWINFQGFACMCSCVNLLNQTPKITLSRTQSTTKH